MALYVRFIFSLAVGLFGVGLVLKIILDEFFRDWNVVYASHDAVQEYYAERARRLHVRPEDRVFERERQRVVVDNLRLNERRQKLAELASVERRLQNPVGGSGPIALTPIVAHNPA